jgi:hypothetical protein
MDKTPANRLDQRFQTRNDLERLGFWSPLAVGGGIDRDFVYATARGENTFTVIAVDRAGNTSEASNAVTEVC